MFSFLLAGNRHEAKPDLLQNQFIEKTIASLTEFSTVILLSNDRNWEIFQRSHENVIFQYVPDDTSGALITAAYGLSKIDSGQPFLVVPSNSALSEDLIQDFSFFMESKDVQVGAVVFQSVNPLYSYARLGQSNQVIEIIEKKVDGSCAMAGVYYFNSKASFEKCLHWTLINNINVNELFYISPALNYFLANAIDIELFEVSSEDYTRLD
jgi:hypothetical protein